MTIRRIPSQRKKIIPRLQKMRSWKKEYIPLEPISFSLAKETALLLAKHIELNFEEIASILLEYESFEVVRDEVNRALDLLKNLDENKKYFHIRIGAVTSFLPKNQPLYALTCFVIIPSLMSTEVHFRIPHAMKHFFSRLLDVLKVKNLFPNILVSTKERLDFLEERTAFGVDPLSGESVPVTDVVIFTGTPHHAERLRLVFDKRTLFIANGAGHNPVVIGEDADLSKAVEAVVTLQLYNQGQDCAAPNAILVHKKIITEFLYLLRKNLKQVKVGFYEDRTCRVGPISEPEDLNRIQSIFIENRHWLDSSTVGIIRTKDAIVEPTVIVKPLSAGGNFTEVFAPIFFIQEYEDDTCLSLYFEDTRYERNAMYISLFGKSNYILSLIKKSIAGKILHDKFSILQNTHLHESGIERGTQPYGGYGYGASSISIKGKIFSKPTLPQRDIYDHIMKPIFKVGAIQERRHLMKRAKILIKKDIRKILGVKFAPSPSKSIELQSSILYLDSKNVAFNKKRYIFLPQEKIFSLLLKPNFEHIASMDLASLKRVRNLRKYLKKNKKIDLDSLIQFLYSTSDTKTLYGQKKKKNLQLSFFRDLYQLLFGKDSGPRLASFIFEADRNQMIELLNA